MRKKKFQQNTLTEELYFYIGNESLFETVVPWFYITVKESSQFYLNKN